MNENEVVMMVLWALVIGVIIYSNIKKLTSKLDAKSTNFTHYLDFCDDIIRELDTIKCSSEAQKDEILSLKNEIKHIASINANIKSEDIWEDKLFTFLTKLDESLNEKFENGKELGDKIRSELQDKFRAKFNR